MKQFTSVSDVDDIDYLVQKALEYKKDPGKDLLKGQHKRIGCVFMNPSMRTRLSTQVAAQNLGMEAIIFNAGSEGWAMEFMEGAVMNGTTVEHIKDAAPILGSYFDILAIRTFPTLTDKELDYSEYYLRQFIKYAGVPVISLESATRHPLQSLTDVITISETFTEKRRPKVVLTWAPHVKALPQCVANSFAEWINAWGEADFVITHPEGYELDREFTGGADIIYNQDNALKDADYVYVKNWSSYTNYGKVLTDGKGWMLNNDKLKLTNNARVMHCLPVRRNVELSDEVLDGANSIITQQASNRVWAAQAVISEMLNG
ncbi:MAG TPA: acetylornithine carbamoyltransferase [Chitinophagaceae bacterium]